MKQLLYICILEISKIISKLGLVINFPILSSLAFAISLRFLKSKIKNKKKNILILEKSHGIDDIKQISRLTLDKNIRFILLSRRHLRIIYNFFRKNKNTDLYKNYVNKVFFYFNKIINIDLIISFNLRYKSERVLQKLDQNLNIRYLVCQKECLFNEDVLENLKNYFLKLDRFTGDHITVYNEQLRSMIVSTNHVDQNKITAVGMSRADFYFNKKAEKQNHILFFLINPDTGLIDSKLNFSWDELAEDTLITTLNFAKKNPHIKFIFKAKIIDDNESYKQQKLIKDKNLNNCSIIFGGNSNQLILDSKVIIAFNSTAIFEALACKKDVIIPYFKEKFEKNLKKYIINTSNSENIFHAQTKNQIENILENIFKNKKKISYRYSDADKELLEKYIGNSDGNSSKRLTEVIEKIINI